MPYVDLLSDEVEKLCLLSESEHTREIQALLGSSYWMESEKPMQIKACLVSYCWVNVKKTYEYKPHLDPVTMDYPHADQPSANLPLDEDQLSGAFEAQRIWKTEREIR